MAGVLNFTPPPIFRSLSSRKTPNSRFCTRSSADISETPTFSPPPNFKAPPPKRFAVRPDKVFDILGASLALVFRLGTGVFVDGYSASFVSKNEIPSDQYALEFAGLTVKETSKLGPRPEKPIEIYEFERLNACVAFPDMYCHETRGNFSCPFCRKVREIVAVLDLDVLFYPCPKNGPNFRPKAAQMGGKQQFPYMVDPNTGVAMYESDDIIKYLVGKYGNGNVPFFLSLGLLTTLTEGFAMIGRMGKPSPFCKVVREVLVELELPHILHSCARGSPKRHILYQKAGHFQVPYLEDPNTGIEMFESAEIVEYLRATYAL
ncbi:hypothetical protein RJ639_044936 [Escallonia herrerae]|uniref:GST N-terminal domain-containing protein n=1 Tax=Escallonia herrerae TaxID=1293975 RepID=A0AA88WFV2_9ASTE|nr:hypothetical protein RJ639_044936 [Escallonia herrerae]